MRVRPARPRARVLSTYGHTHSQACHGRNAEGECDIVMSGGGGGCCAGDLPGSRAGFSAVRLKDDGGFIADVEGVHVSIANWQNGADACKW